MNHLLESFQADWVLAQKARHTIRLYISYLRALFAEYSYPTAAEAKRWVASASTAPVQRKRAQAVRAFGKWAEVNELNTFDWWQLSDEGFEYIERTNREGRYRRIRNYDSLIDVYGKRMCYLPNEVDRLELSISELLVQQPVWHKASRKIAFHLYDNYMIRTTGFVSMTLDSPQYSTEINSVFKSIVQINQILGNQKT